jgi:hypothetical protein
MKSLKRNYELECYTKNNYLFTSTRSTNLEYIEYFMKCWISITKGNYVILYKLTHEIYERIT